MRTSPSTGTIFSILSHHALQSRNCARKPFKMKTAVLGIAAVLMALSMAAQAAECAPDCPCDIPKLLDAQALPTEVMKTALQRQYDVLRKMSLDRIEYSPQGPISQITGQTGFVLPTGVAEWKEGDPADVLLPILQDILLAKGSESLRVKEMRAQGSSARAVILSESVRGIPVINGLVGVKYDTGTMRVTSVVAHFVPDRELPRTPKLSAAQAEQLVPGEVNEPAYLGYYVKCCGPTRPKLVWAIGAWTTKMSEMFYVDAITGVIVDRVQTTIIG